MKAKILLVEDDASLRRTLSYFLKANEYEVIDVEGGRDALQKLEKDFFDLILTDLLMPGMNGIELINQIKQSGHDIPSIVITGDESLHSAIEALKSGAYDYIIKPFQYKEILFPIQRAIERQRLSQRYDGLIKALSNLIDMRDGYTNQHSQKVAEYAISIAEKMDLDEKQKEEIRYGALLHDIGKLGIQDSILHKPNELTEEETHTMRNHITLGANVLKDFTFLGEASSTIASHHEKYDGSGYPQGLKGEEIPLGARITAVADAYQAMTSDRPYRKALPKEAAVKILTNQSGKQFDPIVVTVLLEILECEKGE